MSSTRVDNPYSYDYGYYTTEARCEEKPTHSGLLGPDGKPLRYEPPQRIGFDLTRREVRK